jgi:transcriptional regulator with XRE-family HTH domain
MGKERPSGEVVADNVRRLMAARGLSQAELGRRTGVAQTLISGLLSQEPGKPKNPTASTVEKIASFFRIAAWQLYVPGLTPEMLESDELGGLLRSYTEAAPIGRETILRVAETESRYGTESEARQRA